MGSESTGSDAMSDRIELSGLEFTAIVGVLPGERARAQPLVADLVLNVDLSAAGVSDHLADTIDYAAVCDTVVEVARGAEPLLLERLATLVADAVVSLDERIDSVQVSIAKSRPPVAHLLERAGVRITRRRTA